MVHVRMVNKQNKSTISEEQTTFIKVKYCTLFILWRFVFCNSGLWKVSTSFTTSYLLLSLRSPKISIFLLSSLLITSIASSRTKSSPFLFKYSSKHFAFHFITASKVFPVSYTSSWKLSIRDPVSSSYLFNSSSPAQHFKAFHILSLHFPPYSTKNNKRES